MSQSQYVIFSATDIFIEYRGNSFVNRENFILYWRLLSTARLANMCQQCTATSATVAVHTAACQYHAICFNVLLYWMEQGDEVTLPAVKVDGTDQIFTHIFIYL